MKLDILFHYDVNPTTGEITFIGKEEVTVDTSKKSTSTSKVSTSTATETLGGDTPKLVLEDSKYLINPAAASALGAVAGDTIHVHYRKHGDAMVPSIGKSERLGVKSGNKLTKTLTVSYRGAANTKLSEYGTEFTFEPTDKEGIFYLIGDRSVLPTVEDLGAVNINDDLELDSLDNLDLDNSSTDISGLDLTF